MCSCFIRHLKRRPRMKRIKARLAFLALFSLCSSGIRSEAAIYIKPPAVSGEVVGTVTLVYNHHCLEVLVVRGKSGKLVMTSTEKKLA